MYSCHRAPRIAILMYHSIRNSTETRLHPYYKTVTTPARFAQQMQWIAESGAEVVALENWNAPQTAGGMLRVIITFDDGFADFMAAAFPVLRTHGYCATMFLPTAFIDTGKVLVAQQEHLSWEDVAQLRAEGIRFGSHTVNHLHLERLTREEIFDEVQTSAQTIHKHGGAPVTSFSCPFAFPQAHPATRAALRTSLVQCGYTTGVTTRIGTVSLHDDPYTLKRLPINTDDDKRLFMAKLYGEYNWVNGLQRAVRLSKRIVHG